MLEREKRSENNKRSMKALEQEEENPYSFLVVRDYRFLMNCGSCTYIVAVVEVCVCVVSK